MGGKANCLCLRGIWETPKPSHSRRGLLMLVGRRRRLLNYLQKKDLEGYRSLIRELGLRR